MSSIFTTFFRISIVKWRYQTHYRSVTMIRPCPTPRHPPHVPPLPFDNNNGHRLTPAGFKLDILVVSGIRAVRLNFNLCSYLAPHYEWSRTRNDGCALSAGAETKVSLGPIKVLTKLTIYWKLVRQARFI